MSSASVQSRKVRPVAAKVLEALVSTLLPIFPLDVVLLPGVPLPLHIFEPRYKEMITECLDQKKPFGVVRSKEEGIAEIGCTAEIIAVTKKHSDGRMDIVTEGRERFEVMQLNQERSFLQAEVLYLQDEPGGAPAEKISQALKLHGEILSLAEAEPEALSEIDGSKLSFHLAGSLPLDPDLSRRCWG
jgi:Lon protease-like protein